MREYEVLQDVGKSEPIDSLSWTRDRRERRRTLVPPSGLPPDQDMIATFFRHPTINVLTRTSPSREGSVADGFFFFRGTSESARCRELCTPNDWTFFKLVSTVGCRSSGRSQSVTWESNGARSLSMSDGNQEGERYRGLPLKTTSVFVSSIHPN